MTQPVVPPPYHSSRFPLSMGGLAVASALALLLLQPHENSNGFLGNPWLIFQGAIPVAFLAAAFASLRRSPDEGTRLVGKVGLAITIAALVALLAVFAAVWYGLRSLMYSG